MNRLFARLLSAATAVLAAFTLPAQTGHLDTTFKYQGPAATVTAAARDVRTVVVAVDAGKIGRQRASQLLRLDNQGRVVAQSTSFVAQVKSLIVTVNGDIVVGGNLPGGVARFTAALERATNFNVGAGANRPVFAVAEQADGRLLVAGQFTRFGTSNAFRVVRLLANGARDTTFNPPLVNNAVNALALLPGDRVALGGSFSVVGTTRTRVAVLRSNGTLDATFSAPALNGPVNALAATPSAQLVAAGSFTRAGTQAAGRIARLQTNGAVDATFLSGAGANRPVRHLVQLANDRLLLAGDFTTFSGATVPRLARLLADGSLDGSFQPGAASRTPLSALAASGSAGLACGSFTIWNGATQHNLVRLFGDARIAVPPADITVQSGTDAAFTVTIGSAGPIFFQSQWSFNGQPIAGANATNLVLVAPQSPAAGIYSVSINTANDFFDPPAALLTITTPTNSAPGVVSFPDERNLREAIAASTNVTFATDGVIQLSASLRVTNALTLDGAGRNAKFQPPAGQSVFTVAAGGGLALSRFVFADHYLTGGEECGGAVLRNEAGDVTVTDCTFTNNSVRGTNGVFAGGGAIRQDAGTLTVWNCYFINNRVAGAIGGRMPLSAAGSDAGGGAIHSAGGSVALLGSVFIGNVADGGDPAVMNSIFGAGRGGAVSVAGGALSSVGSRYTGNRASGGLGSGGAWSIGGTASSLNDQFFGNSAIGIYTDRIQPAESRGGAIANTGLLTLRNGNLTNNAAVEGIPSQGGAIYSDGVLLLGESLVAFNRAEGVASFGQGFETGHDSGDGRGGGLSLGGMAGLTNLTCVYNTARGGDGTPVELATYYLGKNGLGGGIHAFSSNVFLQHVTLARNHATAGGGKFPGIVVGGSLCLNGGHVWMAGSVFSESTPHNVGDNTPVRLPGFFDAGANISSDATPIFWEIASGNDFDLFLGPLQDNGGPTLTMDLDPFSPAVDIGEFGPAFDQRGLPRPVNGGWDSGAFERQ